jgi:hypothetical protein
VKAAPLLFALLAPFAGTTAALPQNPESAAPRPIADAANPAAPAPALRVLPTGGLRAETAALLLSGQEGGGLPVAVLALPLPPGGDGGGPARVPVFVEVDGSALLAGHEETALTPLNIEICLYAVSPGGGVLSALLDTVEVGGEGLALLARSGLKFHGELSLPPGEASLRILVRNPATGAVSLRRIALSVPAFRAESPLLLPPLFAEAREAWLTARAAEGAGPLPGEGEGPAARPVLAAGGEAAFQVLAGHLGPEPRLTVELRQREGASATELPVRVTGRAAGGAPGFELLSATVALRGIEPGEYELRLAATGAAEPIRSPALPVVVTTGKAGRTWAELTAPAGSEPEANPAGEAAGKGARQKRRHFAAGPLRAAYREALRPLSTGDEAGAQAAQAAVLAFETTQLVTDPEPLAPEDLLGIEAQVVVELAKRDPESIVALLMLYERLYREALGRRSYLVATHDGDIVFGLTELYARRSTAANARALAAGFLADLARGQTGPVLGGFEHRALSRALTYDEGNEAALLALAVDAERHGAIRDAAGLLERLLRRHPESREAKLRLGIAQARLGSSGRARQLLGEVVADFAVDRAADPAEDRWLLSLAYQELARSHLAGGHPELALQTVEEGLARLPGDEALLLEQAALLDRRGEHARAREALAALAPRAEGGGSPRHRYNQPPEAAFERAFRELAARSAERLPAFAKALGSGARSGKGQP